MPDIGSSSLLWTLPACYIAATIGIRVASSRRLAWRCAEGFSLLNAMLALSAAVIQIILSFAGVAKGDAAGCTMAVLIALLGWVIVRYSHNYLDGEPGQGGYLQALMWVLAAVTVLVLSRNLAIILISWAASSLALHKLLTFYPQRQGAMLAAHKKFIVSRLAELCFAGALILFYLVNHSLSLSQINNLATIQEPHKWLVHTAMLLVVAAVILKAAQLPFHGWLIQVMEAPTPVSALLHAGVVNIGGFILIRLAPLVIVSEAARVLLMAMGTLTATLAGLAMMTRIDIKTRLAWSTCAQMGFMLLECGLGFISLAFLHLVAHSLYKAYGFLSSGDSVYQTTLKQRQPHDHYIHRRLQTILRILGAPLSIAIAFIVARYLAGLVPTLHSSRIAIFIAGLASAPLFWLDGKFPVWKFVLALILESVIVSLYLLWHLVFMQLHVSVSGSNSPVATGFVVLSFSLMYLIQIFVQTYPQIKVLQKTYGWVSSGFYLDEAFNRLTQRIWPLKRTFQTTSALTLGIGKRIAGDYK